MQALLNAIAAMTASHEARRIFHGRGGLHPGCEQWTLDAYPPALVLTSFAPVTQDELAVIGAALQARWAAIAPHQPLNWVFQQRGEVQRQQGVSDTRLMSGSLPEAHVVEEGGLRYRVHTLKGQNHGLFLDTAAARRWVAGHVAACAAVQPEGGRGVRVLNLFAYTCAFSVVARRAGAAQVVNVDMGRGAMSSGQHNHRLNGLEDGVSFLVHDIFTSWGKIARSGPYDLVIADPPSYQKGSFVATKDYARVVRRLPNLLMPGGHALLCLNAPELGAGFLREQVAQHAPGLEFAGRVQNPPEFADASPERALKALVFRAPR